MCVLCASAVAGTRGRAGEASGQVVPFGDLVFGDRLVAGNPDTGGPGIAFPPGTPLPTIVEAADAAAGTSTGYVLSPGQTARGTLSTGADHDWYRVSLTAGQAYTFAMVGTGASNVADTYLRLYAADGTTIVAQADDSLQNNNSIFTFTPGTTGTYYIDAGSFNNAFAGQYGVSFTAGNRASFDALMGAGVLDTNQSWGQGAVVTYAFRDSLTDSRDAQNQPAPFAQATAAQIAAFEQALAAVSEVANISFQRVNPGGYSNNATILVSGYTSTTDGAGAFAYYPGNPPQTGAGAIQGDVRLNNNFVSTTSLPQGSYSYFTLLHEIGHAVGLSHPGLYNAAPGVSITYNANAQFTQDTHEYTLMSYFDESNTTTSYGAYPDGLMILDIYALQQIYGANNSTRTGNTVYGFNSNAGGIYNFATNSSPAFSIWDAGGSDAIDASGYGNAQLINLQDGTFSNIGGLTANISIAIGVTIENATTGSGNDLIYLSSANVNNVINGNGGSDTVYVTYNFGSGYSIQAGSTATNLIMSGTAGTDTLQNIEFVSFANGTPVSVSSLLGGGGATQLISNFTAGAYDDVLYQNASTGQLIFNIMNAGSSVGWGAITGSLGLSWIGVGSGDSNNNGYADAFIRNVSTGQVYVAQMGASGFQGWTAATTVMDSSWIAQGIGDINNNGHADVVVQNQFTGTIYVANVANGSHSSWTLVSSSLTSDWVVRAVGDINNDGCDDVIIQNALSGTTYYANMSGGVFNGWSSIATNISSVWVVKGAADVTGDGRADVIFQNAANGTTYYANVASGSTTWGVLATDIGVNWQVQAVADVDGDRSADVIFQNNSTGTTYHADMNQGNFAGWGVVATNIGTGWLVV